MAFFGFLPGYIEGFMAAYAPGAPAPRASPTGAFKKRFHAPVSGVLGAGKAY